MSCCGVHAPDALQEGYSRAPATLERALLGHGERSVGQVLVLGKRHEMRDEEGDKIVLTSWPWAIYRRRAQSPDVPNRGVGA